MDICLYGNYVQHRVPVQLGILSSMYCLPSYHSTQAFMALGGFCSTWVFVQMGFMPSIGLDVTWPSLCPYIGLHPNGTYAQHGAFPPSQAFCPAGDLYPTRNFYPTWGIVQLVAPAYHGSLSKCDLCTTWLCPV